MLLVVPSFSLVCVAIKLRIYQVVSYGQTVQACHTYTYSTFVQQYSSSLLPVTGTTELVSLYSSAGHVKRNTEADPG